MLAAMKKMDLDRLRKAEKAMTDLEKNPTKQDIRQKKTGRHLPGVRRPREPILWCRITLKAKTELKWWGLEQLSLLPYLAFRKLSVGLVAPYSLPYFRLCPHALNSSTPHAHPTGHAITSLEYQIYFFTSRASHPGAGNRENYLLVIRGTDVIWASNLELLELIFFLKEQAAQRASIVRDLRIY
ncbi:hypothetical protein J6590_044181 [Homalodisca vitripennis]|nr:hypothetical protein J6590_044181 [Homalodisca vitripennis]